MDRYDCIVVGAGPAGATAARRLALNGLKTLLIEKEALPRYKPCGGATTPAIAQILDIDHLMAVERVVRGVTFFSRDEQEDCTFYPDSMKVQMVSRADFDMRLIEAAVSAGAALMEETNVISVEESENHITVRTAGGDSMTGLVVVGADGAKSIVARNMGLYRGPGGAGIEAELYPRDVGVLEQYADRAFFGFGFIPKGYGWVFPKKDHFSVGIAATLERIPGLAFIYRQFMERFEFLRDAREGSRKGWFVSFSKGPGLLNTHRACLAGDAACLTDPFSGEGIYYAVLSGAIAADTVADELEERGGLSKKFTKEINRRIVKDFTYAKWCADIFFLSPQFFYRRNRVVSAFARLANKQMQYKNVLNELRKGMANHGIRPLSFQDGNGISSAIHGNRPEK